MNLTPVIVLVAALLGCTRDGPEVVLKGLSLVRAGRRLGRIARTRLKATRRRQASPCRCAAERHERIWREMEALDVFANSTLHEEPEAWRR
jgi:hypothetical protein